MVFVLEGIPTAKILYRMYGNLRTLSSLQFSPPKGRRKNTEEYERFVCRNMVEAEKITIISNDGTDVDIVELYADR